MSELGPFDRLEMSFPAGVNPNRADVQLLVGPNGSGKSTVLAAIAQCFTPRDTGGFAARMHGPNAYAMTQTESGWFAVCERRMQPSELEGVRLRLVAAKGHQLLASEQDQALLHATLEQPPFEARVDAAVFAYGALRTAAGGPRVSGIAEQADNPLVDATSFHRPTGAASFVQWLANSLAQRALSAERGERKRNADRAAAIARVERALSDAIGGSVEFALDATPRFRVGVSVDGAPPLEVDQLPDGLQSLLAWLGDLLMRLDRILWDEPGPVAVPMTDRSFVLLLDEVDVHLHPAWQRKVLPMVEQLFPNAQILCSTHSPFVIASATDAWIHVFSVEGGRATVAEPQPSALGSSYSAVLDSILGVPAEFDVDSEARLVRFREAWRLRLAGDASAQPILDEEANVLRARSPELHTIVETELRELRHRLARAATP